MSEDVQVVRDPGQGLADRAKKAVKKWKFKPAIKDGKPVMVKTIVEVVFHLPN
jgi:protein TonB